MKIHTLSDLHTEFAPYIPSSVAQDVDLVILAGDIAVRGRGVDFARKAFCCPIIYVPGFTNILGNTSIIPLKKMRTASCERVRVMWLH